MEKWALPQEASSFLAQKIRSEMLLEEIVILPMVRNVSGFYPGFSPIRGVGSGRPGSTLAPASPEAAGGTVRSKPLRACGGRHDRYGALKRRQKER